MATKNPKDDTNTKPSDKEVIDFQKRYDASQSKKWTNSLIMQGNRPAPQTVNAVIALKQAPQLQNLLKFDEFSQFIICCKAPPWAKPNKEFKEKNWTDTDTRNLQVWMQNKNIMVGPNQVNDAVDLVAMEKSFHPIKIYLENLEWDQKPRLGKWLTNYLGVESNKYVKAVGIRWMVSSVARIMQPGCKADCILILEGAQGTRKSTALKTLFDPWFTDEIAEFGSKDACLQMSGRWCIEVAELDAMSRIGVDRLKSFLSRSVDRFRPPFGRKVIDVPRSSILVGTVNPDSYLKDQTGNRRFWPVKTGTIKIDMLEHDRDQLFAEALVLYRKKHPWWLETTELIKEAALEQDIRVQSDPWEERITQYTLEREVVSVNMILEKIMLLNESEKTKTHERRVGTILRKLGYERKKMRVSGELKWRFVRTELNSG